MLKSFAGVIYQSKRVGLMGHGVNTTPREYEWSILHKPLALHIAAGSLVFWAATINGLATVSLVFGRISHMSGRIIDQVPALLYNFPQGLLVSTLLFGFFIGTILGTVALPRFKLTGALLLAMLPVIVAAAFVNWGFYGNSSSVYPLGRYILACLLPMGMGMQNSITSQTSIGRTTHMTGDMTDLGISIARGNWERVRYLGLKYGTFLAGGFLGFVGAKWSPFFTLVLGVGGIVATACFLQYWEQNEQRNHRALRT